MVAISYEPWELVRNSDGKVVREFNNQESAWWYANWDGLYAEPKYTIRPLTTGVVWTEAELVAQQVLKPCPNHF
jgi:hypothetical protein